MRTRLAVYFVRFVCAVAGRLPPKFHDRIHYWIWNWIDGGYIIGSWGALAPNDPEPLWDLLTARFPCTAENRPGICTRRRYKPYIDDCGCWWCDCLDHRIMSEIEREG